MIANDWQGYRLSKKIILQIVVKLINNIASSNSLISTLLVFEAYPHILKFDAPTLTII